MSNQLWYKQNGNWVNPSLKIKSNNYAEAIIYYKAKNRWILLENNKIQDIIWTTDILSKCSTRQDFSNLVTNSFNNQIEENNILNSNTYSVNSTYGVDIRHSPSSNEESTNLFKTKPLPLPKSISWIINYRATSQTPMGQIVLYLSKNNTNFAILRYIDCHVNGNYTNYDGGYIDNSTKLVKTHNGYGPNSWTCTVNLPNDCPNCNLDINSKYQIGLYNWYRYSNTYATAPMYLTKLEIKF